MGIPVQITIDCHDPSRLEAFWNIALDYTSEPPPEGYGSWQQWLAEQGIPESDWNSSGSVVDPDGRGPRIWFQRVPEEKVVKNRVHIDINAGGPRGTPLEERWPRVIAHANRLVKAGGAIVREVEEQGGRWYVMRDPEGNEFCIQ